MQLTGNSYDSLMGTVMDAQDHPANNMASMLAAEAENNPMNPASEMGQQPMKAFSSFTKNKKTK